VRLLKNRQQKRFYEREAAPNKRTQRSRVAQFSLTSKCLTQPRCTWALGVSLNQKISPGKLGVGQENRKKSMRVMNQILLAFIALLVCSATNAQTNFTHISYWGEIGGGADASHFTLYNSNKRVAKVIVCSPCIVSTDGDITVTYPDKTKTKIDLSHSEYGKVVRYSVNGKQINDVNLISLLEKVRKLHDELRASTKKLMIPNRKVILTPKLRPIAELASRKI
jgi:hypothetical protein